MKADNNSFIDTHCHLDHPLLFGRLADIISAAGSCGVGGFIVPGVEPQNWGRIISLAKEFEHLFAAPGVHPLHADKWNHNTAYLLQRLTPDIVAVGEIGLDYSAGTPYCELQKEVFRAQLRIARDAALPVIIHCRRAFADTLKILAEEQVEKFGGVMHAFSGSVETARECIAMGLKIGVAGTVTWGNAVRPVNIVKEIALQHLLLETDSPDLSPESHRGEVNEPALLPVIARKVAELKGVAAGYVAAVTTENAKTVFQRLK